MKKVIAFTIPLGIIALCYCAASAATNDYIWSQKPASGPLVSRNLTPTVGRLIGFPTSINSPETIILGSGLTLTGSTLSASGGAFSTLSDVSLTSVASGDFLKYNGTAWINRTATNARSDLGLGTLATQNGTISNYAPLASPTFTGTVTMPSLGLVFPDGGGVIGMEFGGGLNKITLKTASLSGAKIVTIPATTGTLITTGDTGTITNTMLAGSIDLTTKVTGTLPYGNGGTGATALTNHGVVTAGASALTTVAPGTSGNVLTSNGTDWTSAAAGGATLGANTFTGQQIISTNGADSAPPLTLTGAWFTGGSTTSTKPQLLIEPAGVTSNGWITSGTGLGISVASSSAKRFIDCMVAGSSKFSVNTHGNIETAGQVSLGGWASLDSNTQSMSLNNIFIFQWSSTSSYAGTKDLSLGRDAPSTLQLGIDHATAATNQAIKAHDVTTGTGAALDLRGGNGSTAGGAVTISTSPTTTPTVRVRVSATGEVFLNLPTSAGTSGSLWNDGGTVKVAP